jgi:hypothetical protein
MYGLQERSVCNLPCPAGPASCGHHNQVHTSAALPLTLACAAMASVGLTAALLFPCSLVDCASKHQSVLYVLMLTCRSCCKDRQLTTFC